MPNVHERRFTYRTSVTPSPLAVLCAVGGGAGAEPARLDRRGGSPPKPESRSGVPAIPLPGLVRSRTLKGYPAAPPGRCPNPKGVGRVRASYHNPGPAVVDR